MRRGECGSTTRLACLGTPEFAQVLRGASSRGALLPHDIVSFAASSIDHLTRSGSGADRFRPHANGGLVGGRMHMHARVGATAVGGAGERWAQKVNSCRLFRNVKLTRSSGAS